MESYVTKYGIMKSWCNDIFIVDKLAMGKMWEQDIFEDHLQRIIQNSFLILDIGAHIGCHSIMYAHTNPSATILSFEPQHKLFQCLTANIAKNGHKNIKAYRCAIGHIKCHTSMCNIAEDGPNHHHHIMYGDAVNKYNIGGVALGKNGDCVDMTTIDHMNLEKVDFIKIDVEGFEPLVLQGGENTIKRDRPIIYFENNQKTITADMEQMFKLDASTIPTANEILTSWGYTITALPEDNYLAIYQQAGE